MNFEFTDQQEMMRRTLNDLLRRVCPPEYARKCDQERHPPREAFSALVDGGWLGIAIPEKYGGHGGSPIDLAILLEVVGYHYNDLAAWVFRNVSHGGAAILHSGSEEQKQEILPKTARGQAHFAFGLTEPDAGSDAAAVSTRADRDGDNYRINGVKNFTSGMDVATHILIVTRTRRGEKKHEGISNFVIPVDREGISWTKLRLLGCRAMGTSIVSYEDVLARADEVLGEVDGGWNDVMAFLTSERLCLAAARTGAAEAALHLALEYAKERKQFGRSIGSFQAVAHMLADMHVLVDTSRLQVYRFAWLVSKGKAGRIEAATLKLFASEAFKKVADLGMQVMGGYGYTEDYAMERHFRDSRLATIGAGTSEVQRNIIGKALGL